MIGKIIGPLLLVLLSSWCFSVFAQKPITQDEEYREMLEDLNRRYEGFFIHQTEEQRWQRERASGVQSVKQKRQAYQAKREAARKGFVRVPPPDMEPARLRWEAEQKKLESDRSRKRQRYVKKRSEIEKVKQSARKIPANQEYDLEE